MHNWPIIAVFVALLVLAIAFCAWLLLRPARGPAVPPMPDFPCSCERGPTRWGNAQGVQYSCYVCHGAAPGPIRLAAVLPPGQSVSATFRTDGESRR